MDHHVSHLRRLADECRQDAEHLQHRTALLSWRGLSGAAFREASAELVRELHAMAIALDVAADAVLVHKVATAEVSLVAAVGSSVVDIAVGAIRSAA
ncbi:hypothetical protein [Nocardioides sp. Kera G14]|uniref:hypothetical protein n=1 Tax=Nocardioides sp. Kera G14 TaxID=2884264 RepID=UPI001D1279EA|nr:hypothetical protein [Nocardioides sp. Kera G14]UDY23696.1 hypothetical protein LH076_16795 [Nocardioides sp. Kera G14]